MKLSERLTKYLPDIVIQRVMIEITIHIVCSHISEKDLKYNSDEIIQQILGQIYFENKKGL